MAWQLVSSAAAHPDYLPYFNELAGDHPEQILVGSDLDWGQDIKRLDDELRARNIDKVSIMFFVSDDFQSHGSVRHGLHAQSRQFPPNRPVSGWIAISATILKWIKGYSWLESFEPVTTVGRSIRLYYIPTPEIRFRIKKLPREESKAPSPE